MGFSVRVCQYANLVQCLATMTTLAKIWKIQVTAGAGQKTPEIFVSGSSNKK